MPIRLDERLYKIATLVDFGRVADVGCDHGKLGYYLLETDRASAVIATDISRESLKKAEELAYSEGVSELMQTRLCDGLDAVKSGEVDSVVIAGLGGDVISGIMARAAAQGKRFKHFILSPNTHQEKVRAQIAEQGHRIVFDSVIECAGKLYTVIKTEEGEEKLGEFQTLFGKFYASDKNVLAALEDELSRIDGYLKENDCAVVLKRRKSLIERALGDAAGNNSGGEK